MTLHLLEAVRARGARGGGRGRSAPARSTGRRRRCRSTRRRRCGPQNPYAVSKASADLLAGFYADAHGLRVIRARAFNHAGPGQEPIYAIASFARQVAAGLEAGEDPVRVVTGNPDTRRDFTDVRDVVRAYRLLAAARRAGRLQRLLRAAGARRASWSRRSAGRGRRRRPRGRPEARPRARGDGGARLLRAAARPRPAGSPRSRSSRRSRTPSRGGARRSARVARARACTSDDAAIGIAPQTLSGRGSASNTRPRPFGQGTYVA